jgi:hypothetical protein
LAAGKHHGPFGIKMVFMPATVGSQGGSGAGAVLDGVLERVTFANPETGYTIARIAPERGDADLVTAVGPLLGAQVAEFLRLRGRWSSHPRYGRQASFAAVDWDKALGWLRGRTGSELAPEQEDAVKLALTSRVAVLTGGPGAGNRSPCVRWSWPGPRARIVLS